MRCSGRRLRRVFAPPAPSARAGAWTRTRSNQSFELPYHVLGEALLDVECCLNGGLLGVDDQVLDADSGEGGGVFQHGVAAAGEQPPAWTAKTNPDGSMNQT